VGRLQLQSNALLRVDEEQLEEEEEAASLLRESRQYNS
jgi:hypothetical protein